MKRVLSRDESRRFDSVAAGCLQIPTLLLMENAGRGAAEAIMEQYGPASVVVVAGTGNNGGDGFVVARHLEMAKIPTHTFVVGEVNRMTGDAAIMHRALVGMGASVRVIAEPTDLSELREALGQTQLAVDALFGTGLSRSIEGLLATVIDLINQASIAVVALDVPSGLDTDEGKVWGVAVRASTTVAFAHLKPIHFTAVGVEHSGNLVVRSIGVPSTLPVEVEHVASLVEMTDVRALLPIPSPVLHKSKAGRVMVVAGAPGTSGAALLAARGALRAGAGLVTHVGTKDTIAGIESRVLEAMTAPLDNQRLAESLDERLALADAIVLGPGLGFAREARLIAHVVMNGAHAPLVIDADAITLLAGDPGALAKSGPPRVLSPHPAEMARLLGCTTEDVLRAPLAAAMEAAHRTSATVVLKGPYSIVAAPGHVPAYVGGPCPALAVGGSGDVLAGMLAALLVAHEPWDAAILAVTLHNQAGRLWQQRTGARSGLLAHEIADLIPAAFASLAERAPPIA